MTATSEYRNAQAALQGARGDTRVMLRPSPLRTDGLLSIDYDTERDVLTIEGVQYAGSIFRSVAIARPEYWYKYERDDDGTVIVYQAMRLPKMCTDYDSECEDVAEPRACHQHSPERGWCPRLVRDVPTPTPIRIVAQRGAQEATEKGAGEGQCF